MGGKSSVLITVILVGLISVGCGRINSIQLTELQELQDTSSLAASPPADLQEPDFVFEALSWESVNPNNRKWSNYLFNVISDQELIKLDSAQDTHLFCPQYDRLTKLQKVNFWGALISGMTRYESSYKPTTRLIEQGLGNDAVTGRQVTSEGLLQLSYSDSKYHSFCRMDWSKDRKKKDTDPTKTIFDPYINLECGLKILSKQISRHGKIVIDSGAYWSVIKSGHRNEKVSEISSIVQRLSFCRN